MPENTKIIIVILLTNQTCVIALVIKESDVYRRFDQAISEWHAYSLIPHFLTKDS